MMYNIVGFYKGEKEIIDEADNFENAEYLMREYQIAFGKDWTIYIESSI